MAEAVLCSPRENPTETGPLHNIDAGVAVQHILPGDVQGCGEPGG